MTPCNKENRQKGEEGNHDCQALLWFSIVDLAISGKDQQPEEKRHPRLSRRGKRLSFRSNIVSAHFQFPIDGEKGHTVPLRGQQSFPALRFLRRYISFSLPSWQSAEVPYFLGARAEAPKTGGKQTEKDRLVRIVPEVFKETGVEVDK